MRISAAMRRALDAQLALESDAANAYLAMASWCEATGYEGGAACFYAQSEEERQHLLKIIHYLNDAGAPARIPAAKEPAGSFRSLEAALKAALKSEQRVTAAIHALVGQAEKDGDRATVAFLEWFVNEQVEEETKFENLLQKFDLLGRDKLAVHEIDKLLAAAAVAAPGPAA